MSQRVMGGALAFAVFAVSLLFAGCAGGDVVEVAGHKVAVPSGSQALEPENWDARYLAPLDPEKVLEFYSKGSSMKSLGWDLGSYSEQEQMLCLTLAGQADVYFYAGGTQLRIEVKGGRLDGQSILSMGILDK